eukprot:gene620-675_t
MSWTVMRAPPIAAGQLSPPAQLGRQLRSIASSAPFKYGANGPGHTGGGQDRT